MQIMPKYKCTDTGQGMPEPVVTKWARPRKVQGNSRAVACFLLRAPATERSESANPNMAKRFELIIARELSSEVCRFGDQRLACPICATAVLSGGPDRVPLRYVVAWRPVMFDTA